MRLTSKKLKGLILEVLSEEREVKHLEEAKRQLLAQHKAPEGQSKRDQQQANRSWDSVLDWLDVELANFAKTKVEL